ncbi:MAG TPA: response regulator [Terriglobales bacterium]|nr:response regulator [Terriglobales bacterium]
MAAAAAPARQSAHCKPRRQTVLVVEDEAFVRDAICELLEQGDYDVLRAENACSARKLFKSRYQEIDVVLCDAVLPDWNGVFLIKALRQLSPGLKVVLTSGYPLSEAPHQVVNAQEMRLLVKPYSGSALIAILECALRDRSPNMGTTSVCGTIADGFQDHARNLI